MTAPAIGIDLGTTNSCAAVFRAGTVEVIENPHGNRVTPSIVRFGDNRLVGDDAKDDDFHNAENTVFSVKRLIGRSFDDPHVQRDMKLWPFKVVEEQGRPKIQVTHRGETKTFFPEEISSMVLGYMKSTAEAKLGKTVRNAVVTVPAYFNDSQRQATKDAATIAGMNVLRIINEPTAAALAYGLGDTDGEEKNVLIYDLGGGTFDVSVLTIEEGIFEVRSTAGNTHLGGEDFDAKMVDHFLADIQKKYGKDLKSDKQALRRLLTASCKAKHKLSSATEASVSLLNLAGIDYQATVSRARFEELCGDMIRSTLNSVKEALQEAQMTKEDICDVVLVGGSTRIPAVQELLRSFFGKPLNQIVNPDEAVAFGAAVQAAILDGDRSDTITDLVLVDVTPLSLGIDVDYGLTSIIIPRNTTIPIRKTRRYTTLQDYQKNLDVPVVEGERTLAKDNNLLGQFTVYGITKAPRGVAKIDVTFEIDANGILNASAVDITNNAKNAITIVNEKGRLSKADIDRMIKDAELFKKEDELARETLEARNALEEYCYSMRNKVKNANIANSSRNELLDRINETLSWIERNSGNADKETFQQKKRELELVCDMTLFRM